MRLSGYFLSLKGFLKLFVSVEDIFLTDGYPRGKL